MSIVKLYDENEGNLFIGHHPNDSIYRQDKNLKKKKLFGGATKGFTDMKYIHTS